jgi:hypothetical protein
MTAILTKGGRFFFGNGMGLESRSALLFFCQGKGWVWYNTE